MATPETQPNTAQENAISRQTDISFVPPVHIHEIRPFTRPVQSLNGYKQCSLQYQTESSPPAARVPLAAYAPIMPSSLEAPQNSLKLPKPLTETTILEISTRAQLNQRFDSYRQAITTVKGSLPSNDRETKRKPLTTNLVEGEHACFPTFLLTGTLVYLEILANPPRLPARLAHIFEREFKRVEPMFHTVFYRKYHPAVLADAKQEALLGLYKKWLKNRYLLQQSAAYIVTAGIYSVSNWRQKSQEIRASEGPLAIDNHGKVIGQHSQTAAIRGTDYLDFQIDLADAVDTILSRYTDDDDYAKTYAVMLDIVDEVKFTEGQNRLGVKRGEYMTRKNQLKEELRQLLRAYEIQAE